VAIGTGAYAANAEGEKKHTHPITTFLHINIPLQQWLRETTSLLRYNHKASLVIFEVYI